MRRLAAIDIGTNTVRVLVADDRGSGPLQHVERGQRIVRLGRGVDASGRLDVASVARTLSALEDLSRAARTSGADQIRVAGTSALRDARDRSDFADAVAVSTGAELEILAGAEEGRLAHLGATSWLPDDRTYCVCDVGGGSTELSLGDRAISVDVGSVRLKERFAPDDPPSSDQLAAAASSVADQLPSAIAGVGLRGDEVLVGVAGTITSLAALVLGLERYESDRVHGTTLRASDVAAWAERLGGLTASDVRALGPIEEGRADVLVTGVVIVREVMAAGGWDEMLVSERDILDGLILDLRAQTAVG